MNPTLIVKQDSGVFNSLSPVAICKGAFAGAASMFVYAKVNPFIWINVPNIASIYLVGDLLKDCKDCLSQVDPKTVLLAGAIVGATASVLRSVIESKLPSLKENKKIVTLIAGCAAPAIVGVAKCLLFPELGDVWQAPGAFFFHLATAAMIGGVGATFLAPVGLAGAAFGKNSDSDKKAL